jgi:hypothetical protein
MTKWKRGGEQSMLQLKRKALSFLITGLSEFAKIEGGGTCDSYPSHVRQCSTTPSPRQQGQKCWCPLLVPPPTIQSLYFHTHLISQVVEIVGVDHLQHCPATQQHQPHSLKLESTIIR